MSHVFYRNPQRAYPIAVSGQGVYITDKEGRRYLDACGGAVVVGIGHGVREVTEAARQQLDRIAFAHLSQFTTEPLEELAREVAEMAPGDLKRVLFVSGGSEAVEAAIKLARQYHRDRGQPGRHRIVARWASYHGATLGALSASGHIGRRAPYGPLLLDFPHIPPCYCYRCPYGKTYPACEVACATELDRVIKQEGPEGIAAFIAEPVVGAACGATVPPTDYFARIRAICDQHDILFIADEVMTGFGRTGRNFGIEHWGVVPDIITTGKGISSGYAPLGAVIFSERIHQAIADGSGAFTHGHTYDGHPVSCAIGLAVLRYLKRHRLIERAAEMGPVLMESLGRVGQMPIVGDIRGKGLMIGIELVRDRETKAPFPAELKVAERLKDIAEGKGLLIYPGRGGIDGSLGDHFLVAPPLTITAEEIRELVTLLEASLDDLRSKLQPHLTPRR